MYPVEKKKTQWQFGKFLISLQIVILLFHRASSQDWDGVIITQADFQGLQAFKKELIDPKGFLKSWNDSGFGACSGGWAGIKCAQGQVIVIQLPWKGLGGRLTDKIGQLQALRKLSLHDNMLGGSIPSTLGLLPSLRGLQLFNNRLSGPVPSSLGLCPALQTLDLSNNSLTGAIPPTLANSKRLYWLNLSFNSLSGSIPSSLAASNTLTFLSLQYNNLSGSIPDAIGSASSLRVLDLSHNSINGSIPLAICRLSSLSMLSLESNELHGQLPTDMGTSLRNLTVLDLRKNQLSGPIPGSIGKISALRSLDLSYNNLTDEIPDSVAQLPSLASFNVSYNSLSGPVPPRLASRFNSSSYWGNIQLCGYSPATPCPSPASAPHHKLGVKDMILIAAGSLLLLLLILCFILGCCLLRKNAKAKEEGGDGAAEKASAGSPAAELESGGKLVHFDGPQIFTADDLLCATAEIMGKSTYGTVYKATLEDANQVAVKRLREKITRGQKEFEAEVNVLGKIRHPNLLPLRAYYLGPKGEKLLVFDYIPKGSLQTFLHAREAEMQVNWSTRMRVIKGTTRGLIYLHNTARILHGNLTSSNILIDEDNSAKISDYGLSRLMTAGASSSVIAAAGALGYRAPELSKLKNATMKTDVYSLGVILLELLTGKSPREAMNGVDLPQWVASIVKEEWTSEVFDVELMRDASIIGDQLLNTLKLALHCVDPSPSARPEAQQVLHQLEEITPEGMSSSGDEAFAGPSATE